MYRKGLREDEKGQNQSDELSTRCDGCREEGTKEFDCNKDKIRANVSTSRKHEDIEVNDRIFPAKRKRRYKLTYEDEHHEELTRAHKMCIESHFAAAYVVLRQGTLLEISDESVRKKSTADDTSA